MTELTDQQQIEQLQWSVACLAEVLTRQLPVRSRDIGHAELQALVGDVRARAADEAADARRRILESELAELGSVTG